ncbi:MAG TPA: hypothetical protein GX708_11550 [Gallicola sp.]|nr:hypothetical protein [Gallicola sp.]
MNLVLEIDYEMPKMTTSLGISLLNLAVINSPIRTGNAASSIYLTVNNTKRKVITYDLRQAYYILFLEEGAGKVKRHKGYITQKTVTSMVKEICKFVINKGVPTYTTIPTVILGTDKTRNYERRLIRENRDLLSDNKDLMNLNKVITASDRKELSKAQFYKENARYGDTYINYNKSKRADTIQFSNVRATSRYVFVGKGQIGPK